MLIEELKKRQRLERKNYPPALGLRVHRAISWVQAYGQNKNDLDTQFIQLWIAFNAAYAEADPERMPRTESQLFKDFIGQLVRLDTHKRLEELVWVQFSGTIRTILQNQYIYRYFWKYVQGECSEQDWKKRFNHANLAAKKALSAQDTTKTLSIILSRLYVLRNQLLHGGSTWEGKVNRGQLKSAVQFLSVLMPAIIEIMMDHPEHSWPEAAYPVIEK